MRTPVWTFAGTVQQFRDHLEDIVESGCFGCERTLPTRVIDELPFCDACSPDTMHDPFEKDAVDEDFR